MDFWHKFSLLEPVPGLLSHYTAATKPKHSWCVQHKTAFEIFVQQHDHLELLPLAYEPQICFCLRAYIKWHFGLQLMLEKRKAARMKQGRTSRCQKPFLHLTELCWLQMNRGRNCTVISNRFPNLNVLLYHYIIASWHIRNQSINVSNSISPQQTSR